jgi:tetratricopeptide (TPR) repeat protein
MDEKMRENLQLGRDAYKKREYAKAESHLIQLVDGQQRFADVHNMLGVICHDRGLFKKAQEYFEQALAINPSYIEAALNLSVTYNDLGRYQEAKDVYSRALNAGQKGSSDLDPFVRGKLANMYADIADIYQSFGFYEFAANEYRKALELGPGFVDIRLKLAQVLRDCGKRDEAVTELHRVLSERPAFVPARIHLGITLYSQGKMSEAIAEWQEGLRLDPSNKSCQMYLNLVQTNKTS